MKQIKMLLLIILCSIILTSCVANNTEKLKVRLSFSGIAALDKKSSIVFDNFWNDLLIKMHNPK